MIFGNKSYIVKNLDCTNDKFAKSLHLSEFQFAVELDRSLTKQDMFVI